MELNELDIILKAYGGSQAYGTETETSDVDIRGVAVPPIDYFYGMKRFEQFEESPPQDTIYYDIRKFFNLLMKGNPGILEVIWSPVIEADYRFLGGLRKDIWPKIISKQVVKAHLGMATSHLKRVSTPGRNCGIKGKAAIEKFGYNVKDAHHVIRVLEQCWEIIENKELTLPRPNGNILLAIKNGEWTAERVHERANLLMGTIRAIEEKSNLPNSPDFNYINDWLTRYLTNRFGG